MSANNNRKNARRNKGNLNQADGNIVQVVINIFSKINFSELNNALSKWFVPALFVMAFKDGRIQLVALPTGQSVQPPTDLSGSEQPPPGKTKAVPTPPEKLPGVEIAGLSQPPNIPPNPIIHQPSNSAVSVTNGSENQVETNNASKNTTVVGNNNNISVVKSNDISQANKNAATINPSDKSPDTSPNKKSPGKEVAANAAVQPTVHVTVNVPKQSAPAPPQRIASALPYDRPRSTPTPGVRVPPKAGGSGTTSQPDVTPQQPGTQAPAPKVSPKKQAPARPIDGSNSPRFPNDEPPKFISPTIPVDTKRPVPEPGWGTSPDPDAPASPHNPTDEVQPGTLNIDNRPPNPGAPPRREKHNGGDIAIGLNDGQKPKAAKTEQPIDQNPDIDEPKVGMSKYEQYMERRDPVIEKRQAEDARNNVTPELKRERPPVPRSSSTHEALPSVQAPVPAKYEPVQTAQPMYEQHQDVDSGTLMTSEPGTDTTSGAM
jgi:hypothetical protein